MFARVNIIPIFRILPGDISSELTALNLMLTKIVIKNGKFFVMGVNDCTPK